MQPRRRPAPASAAASAAAASAPSPRALHAFNFVVSSPPSRAAKRGRTPLPALVARRDEEEDDSALGSARQPRDHDESPSGDALLHATLLDWARRLEDPLLSDDAKAARLWHALVRHSDGGRLAAQTGFWPHALCSAMALDAVQRLLATTPASPQTQSVLLGALHNAVFWRFRPDAPAHTHQQFADRLQQVERELRDEREAHARTRAALAAQQQHSQQHQHQHQHSPQLLPPGELLTGRQLREIVQSVPPASRASVLADGVAPLLDAELFVGLWHAAADARQSAEPALAPAPAPAPAARLTIAESRAKAAGRASRVLQERARMLLACWGALSVEEQRVVAPALQACDGPAAGDLPSVLRALEELYIAEQQRQQQAPRRRSTFQPARGSRGATGRQTIAATSELQARAAPRQSQLVAPAIREEPAAALLPEEPAADASGNVEQLTAEQHEILRQCEDVFDLLCLDPEETAPARPKRRRQHQHDDQGAGAVGEADAAADEPDDADADDDEDEDELQERTLRLARHKLCDLLCFYCDAPSYLLEKLERCETQRELRARARRELDALEAPAAAGGPRAVASRGTSRFVQTLIQRQRQNPLVLVHAINQSPEILLSAIAQNAGILRFAIAKCAPVVKRFLKLDLKSCEYLDALANRYKGVQLLWGTAGTGSSGGSGPGDRRLSSFAGVTVGGGGGGSGSFRLLPPGGAGAAAAESHLSDWFTAHTSELAALLLRQSEPLRQLFLELHAQSDASTFYKLMVQLSGTPGVQSFVRRASVATLERLAQEDPAEISRVLRDVLLAEPANRDLLHELQRSPYLATCLSEFHATAMQDVVATDLETWRHFLVEMVTTHDALLREALAQRTEPLDGAETLLQLYDAVLAGRTAVLDLQALRFDATPTDLALAKERESALRRKMQRCVFLRGGATVFRAFLAPQIASGGFLPRDPRAIVAEDDAETARSATTTATTAASASAKANARVARPGPGPASAPAPTPPSGPPTAAPGRMPPSSSSSSSSKSATAPARGGRRLTPSSPKKQRGRKDGTKSSGDGDASESPALTPWTVELPAIWGAFLRLHRRKQQQQQAPAAPLDRAHLKTIVLDLWIEFLKTDHLQLDNACLWTMAPFVCDYLMTRFESPAIVGARLFALVEGLLAFRDDPRVAFFAAACGVPLAAHGGSGGVGYDTCLYYAHALEHLFLGHMKIFKLDRRLEETEDGSCPLERRVVDATAALLLDHRVPTSDDIEDAKRRLSALPAVESGGKTDRVELDDVMAVLLDVWEQMHRHRYRQAFEFYDSGSHHIGLEQFIKIVTSVTHHRVSPRECLLVYCDVGEEYLELDTLLRVTRTYHLRLFNIYLPEVALKEAELQELRLSIGRSNIFSFAREVEDLQRFWRGVRAEVQAQMDSVHQTRMTKMNLKRQIMAVEKLLTDVQTLSHHNPPRDPVGLMQTLGKGWHEVRACAKLVHAAKLTQQYLSRLYIQSCLIRWMTLQTEAPAVLEQENDRLSSKAGATRDRYVGIRSGELFVRMRGAPEDPSSLLNGLSSGLRDLLTTRPSLQQHMAPRNAAVEELRARRERLRLRRQALCQRVDGLRSAVDAVVASAMPSTDAAPAVVSRYEAAWTDLVDVWTQCTRSGVMALYALLEKEREVIQQWRRREDESCDALVRATKRRFQFASFALHLESETLGQIRLWRLPETDAQRVRCVKAATENVKPALLQPCSRVEVSDVYKIENRPLLQSLERFTRRLGRDATKVKGLFCSVPAECLERCVVWGMHVDESHAAQTRRVPFVATSDDAAAEEACATRLFNRPRRVATSQQAPVAEQRVLDAERMAFPRRFSRFSTLSDNRVDAPGHGHVRYLALCRVAMGKTRRLSSGCSVEFPEDPSVGSLYFVDQDEYLVRYPEAVVPEFLVEYRVVESQDEAQRQRLEADAIVPVDLARPVIPRDLLPSLQFQARSDRAIALWAAGPGDEAYARCLRVSEPLPPARRQSVATHTQELSTETALANSAAQRRALTEDMHGMAQALWVQSKQLWDSLQRPSAPARRVQKLYNELALQREPSASPSPSPSPDDSARDRREPDRRERPRPRPRGERSEPSRAKKAPRPKKSKPARPFR
ncbi:hypothetical protein ATCC90586_001021 [Pythium insidiosum]|nr:hypothetical protein ATCC90586_001021 [Pythium insidiosum]